MSTMKELMERMMNTVGGYVEDKVNGMEEMKKELEMKESELEDKQRELREIGNQRQLIEIMIMQLDEEERRVMNEIEEKEIEIAGIRERYESDKLGLMIMNMREGKETSDEGASKCEETSECEERSDEASECECEEVSECECEANDAKCMDDILEEIKNQIKK